jgi:hypothetical protein
MVDNLRCMRNLLYALSKDLTGEDDSSLSEFYASLVFDYKNYLNADVKGDFTRDGVKYTYEITVDIKKEVANASEK